MRRRTQARRARRSAAVAAAVVASSALGGCVTATDIAAPRCRPDRRLVIVAQSVPTASYVPCLDELAPGWAFTAFDVRDGSTSFTLTSDRANRPVRVRLGADCEVGGTTALAPRAAGARTSLRLDVISPRYAGTLYDVFPGGCVSYAFDFERGAHIGLMEDLEGQLRLFSRHELEQVVEDDLGVELDPEETA